ncbi:MAG: hypothetical protein KGZ86_00600 [Candidatus Latescibacteria bacterium]|nr:hypothetical protein [Candidatus Latescibacterota bacterium]
MNRICGFLFVTISLVFTSTFAQEFTLYRINDLVGDTIDVTEQKKYYLFPNITNFESAIFYKSDSIFIANINYIKNDTLQTDTLQLTAFNVNRINYCINNADTINVMISRDEAAKVAYDRFWEDLESKQIHKIQQKTAELKSREGRAYGVATGAMFGSAIGGYVGSQLGIDYVGMHDGCFSGPIYKVNYPIFCGINFLTISTGTYIGYKLGEKKDRNYSPAMTDIKEGKEWRIGLGIFSGIIGSTIGAYTFLYSTVTAFGRINDWPSAYVEGGEVISIPALLVGMSITYNITYWGIQLGKYIDHNRAKKK